MSRAGALFRRMPLSSAIMRRRSSSSETGSAAILSA